MWFQSIVFPVARLTIVLVEVMLIDHLFSGPDWEQKEEKFPLMAQSPRGPVNRDGR